MRLERQRTARAAGLRVTVAVAAAAGAALSAAAITTSSVTSSSSTVGRLRLQACLHALQVVCHLWLAVAPRPQQLVCTACVRACVEGVEVGMTVQVLVGCSIREHRGQLIRKQGMLRHSSLASMSNLRSDMHACAPLQAPRL